MIAIIGGHGFVGSAFARYCSRHGLAHTVIGRDNYQSCIGSTWDLVINANGNSKKFLAKDRPLEEFDASVRSVRMSLQDFRARRYVYISTCDVYPDCSAPATTREDVVPDVTRQSPYGFHKYLAEQCVRHAADHWLIFRLGGCVAPGLRKNPIFDILHGQPLWLDPASALQYLATDEAARIVFTLLEKGLDRETFNLCGRGLISLSEVIEAVGRPAQVRPGSPRVCYDVAIDKLLEQVPVPPSREAVLEFIGAQRNHHSSSLERV
jgi:nucleoside-diphosphate-sugar epimerase